MCPNLVIFCCACFVSLRLLSTPKWTLEDTTHVLKVVQTSSQNLKGTKHEPKSEFGESWGLWGQVWDAPSPKGLGIGHSTLVRGPLSPHPRGPVLIIWAIWGCLFCVFLMWLLEDWQAPCWVMWGTNYQNIFGSCCLCVCNKEKVIWMHCLICLRHGGFYLGNQAGKMSLLSELGPKAGNSSLSPQPAAKWSVPAPWQVDFSLQFGLLGGLP